MKDTFSIIDTTAGSLVPRNVVTLESVLATYHDFLSANPVIVEKLKVSPSVFKQLQNYFEDEEAEKAIQGVKSMPVEDVWLLEFRGMKVEVDTDLKPGTWRFVVR